MNFINRKIIITTILILTALIASYFALAARSTTKTDDPPTSSPLTSQEKAELFEVAQKYLEQRDYVSAFNAFQELSGQGHAPSFHFLAVMYESGQGTERNLELAGQAFANSIASGAIEDAKYLSDKYNICQSGVRRSLASEINDVSQFAKEADACVLVASAGHVEAQYDLAKAYSIGKLVAENPNLNSKWLFQAAKHGHVMAQYELLVSYWSKFTDDRSNKDFILAYGWACAVDGQRAVPNSFGMRLFQRGNWDANISEIKANMDEVINRQSIALREADGICKKYVERYVKVPRDHDITIQIETLRN